MSTTGRRDSVTAGDGTGKYIMSRRGPGHGMDMPRAPSSVVVAFYKAMQLETIGLGLAQKNYTIRYRLCLYVV